jgi:hypothetical protein
MVKEIRMTLRSSAVLFALAQIFFGLTVPSGDAQQISGPVKAVQLTGLTGVKDNAKGTLNVENAQLHFVHAKASSDVSIASIQDVITGADSQRAVGGTIGVISMAAPYGGGRFLSLFRSRIETLTVKYRDADGGLHGAIFTMPVGTAQVIKNELVAQGAHTTAGGGSNAAPAPSGAAPDKEPRQ